MPKHKKIFLKGISFSYIYVFVYLITGVLTTPMLLNHFHSDYFALLMLVYGIIMYLNNIRFGLPESLAALLAKSTDNTLNICMIKKSLLILVFTILVTLVILYISSFYIDDWLIFLGNVSVLNKEEVINVFYILIVFALIKIPLELSLSIFIGFHEVFLEKIYKISNILVNFMLVLFVVYNNESILFFVIWAGLLDLIVSIIAFTHAMIRYGIFKKYAKTKEIHSVQLLKSGLLFFQLSITQTIIWGTGIFLVSHMLSLSAVTVYSLTMKIYIYLFFAFIIINSVIAPLYGKYFAKSAWDEIKKIFNFMILFLPFIGGFIWMGTLYFMSDIITLWIGSQEYYAGHLFVFFMGMFFYFTSYVNSYITLLYSIGEIKSVINIRWKEVIINLLISFFATYFIGLAGIAMGMSLSIILISVRNLSKCIQIKTGYEIRLDYITQKKHFILLVIPSVLIAFVVTTFIEIFFIKLIIFIIMGALYIYFSWNILKHKDKIYIMNLLNHKKRL